MRPLTATLAPAAALALLLGFLPPPAAAEEPGERAGAPGAAPQSPVAEAREFYRQDLASAEARYRNEHGKPFFFDHGERTRVGVLLIHGFTASPWEMEELGRHLYRQGHTVYGARLAGHGTSPEDLRRTTWRDWVASTAHGVSALRAVSDRVYAVGFSTGGLVALDLAAARQVDGVVALAPAVRLSSSLARLAAIAKLFQEYNFRDPPLAPELTAYYYEPRPLTSIDQLVSFGDHVFSLRLGRVRTPILIVQSRSDDVVDPASAELVYRAVRSPAKELRWVEREEGAGHILTTWEHPNRANVFRWVADFIARTEASRGPDDVTGHAVSRITPDR